MLFRGRVGFWKARGRCWTLMGARLRHFFLSSVHFRKRKLIDFSFLSSSPPATNPSLPILGVPDKNLEFALYSFSQLNDAATLLANFYASSNGGGLPLREKGDTTSEMRIAIMAPSGLDYVVMVSDISRALQVCRGSRLASSSLSCFFLRLSSLQEWALLRMGYCQYSDFIVACCRMRKEPF